MEQEIYIQKFWIFAFAILLIFLLIIIIAQILYKNRIFTDLKTKIKEQTLNFSKKEAELKVDYQKWAIDQFEKFKKSEIQKIQDSLKDNSFKWAKLQLQEWKIVAEAEIRKDAINRSYAVNLGKITEHLVPFHQVFLSQFNPKDARFIGSPIDLIVFDGYADKSENLNIYFVEIKTGNSKLSEVQKKVKNAVKAGRVRWAEINPDSEDQIIDIQKSDYESQKTESTGQIFIEFPQPNIELNDTKNVPEISTFESISEQNVSNLKREFLPTEKYNEILESVLKYKKKKYSLNQALKQSCDDMGIEMSKKGWEFAKKLFIKKFNEGQ